MRAESIVERHRYVRRLPEVGPDVLRRLASLDAKRERAVALRRELSALEDEMQRDGRRLDAYVAKHWSKADIDQASDAEGEVIAAELGAWRARRKRRIS